MSTASAWVNEEVGTHGLSAAPPGPGPGHGAAAHRGRPPPDAAAHGHQEVSIDRDICREAGVAHRRVPPPFLQQGTDAGNGRPAAGPCTSRNSGCAPGPTTAAFRPCGCCSPPTPNTWSRTRGKAHRPVLPEHAGCQRQSAPLIWQAHHPPDGAPLCGAGPGAGRAVPLEFSAEYHRHLQRPAFPGHRHRLGLSQRQAFP